MTQRSALNCSIINVETLQSATPGLAPERAAREEKLEQAYEKEKRQSYLFKKSNRIYHQILKTEDV